VPVEFVIDDAADPEYLRTVTEALEARAEPGREERKVWLDTHDWRLFRAGLVLEHHRHRSRPWLVLSDLDGHRISRLPAPASTITAENLPPGAIRDRVLGLVGIRALEPRAVVHGPVQILSVLDAESKTVARVEVEGPARVEGGDDLGVVARVEPLRGYETEARRVVRRLGKLRALEPATEPLFEQVFRARGLEPGQHRSKPDVSFEPDQPVGEAFASTLGQLLDILRDNVDGTLKQLDTEFLHDFRVTVRRSRAVVKFARGVLPDDVRERYRAELKWLGDATSLSRDLDVYLLEYDDMTRNVDDPENLAPFRDLLQRRCSMAHTRLNRAIRSRRFATLVDGWGADLANASTPAEPSVPVLDVSNTLLKRAWKRVEQRGNAITDESPAEAVHDLRQRCKEMRYLLELFASLYDAGIRREFVRELRRLQDNLGEFQDAEAQKFLVAEYAEKLNVLGAPASTLMTMGRLEQHLEARQDAARAEIAQRWTWFDRRHNQRLYKKMVAGR
jgi:CHAD domain-containing protein